MLNQYKINHLLGNGLNWKKKCNIRFRWLHNESTNFDYIHICMRVCSGYSVSSTEHGFYENFKGRKNLVASIVLCNLMNIDKYLFCYSGFFILIVSCQSNTSAHHWFTCTWRISGEICDFTNKQTHMRIYYFEKSTMLFGARFIVAEIAVLLFQYFGVYAFSFHSPDHTYSCSFALCPQNAV